MRFPSFLKSNLPIVQNLSFRDNLVDHLCQASGLLRIRIYKLKVFLLEALAQEWHAHPLELAIPLTVKNAQMMF